jgi:hypothetical protein
MKMSLRERISNIVAEARGEYADTYYISDTHFADIILKLIEKGIDEIKELNTPEHWDNLNAREQVKISHYLLALDDVKELLK